MADENEALSSVEESPSSATDTGQEQIVDESVSSLEVVNRESGQAGNTEQSVPYARFKEKIDESNAIKAQLEEYEQWKTAHEYVKNQFGTPEAYNQALEQAQREAEEAEIAEQVRQRAERDGIDEGLAGQLYETEVVRKSFEKTRGELNQILFQQKLALAKAKYPDFDEETVVSRAKKDGSDLEVIAKKSHEREQTRTKEIEERAIARYNSQKNEQRETLAPEGSGGRMATAQPMPDPKIDRAGWEKWFKDRLRNQQDK